MIIVARINANAHQDVARVFADSDATSLPHDLGVRQRSLYALADCYLHVVDFREDATRSLDRATELPGFRQISQNLRPYIRAYDEATWKKPQDAVAKEFYRWTAPR